MDLKKKINNNEKFIVNNFRLSPKLKVEYLREYYIYKRSVRLTLDHTPVYKNLFNTIKKTKDTFSILEIKFGEKDYDDASNLIKFFKVNSKRYSKYIKFIMKKLIIFKIIFSYFYYSDLLNR